MRFSANLGFLYLDLPLIERIGQAARDGFDAVECHFPYDVPAAEMRAALRDAAIPMIAINTPPGDPARGDFGLAALPGRAAEARGAILRALDYAAEIGARFVHVMAGKSGGGRAAEAVLRENLRLAADEAAARGLGVLIEPINRRDVPGYHYASLEGAARTIGAVGGAVGAPNLHLMFDCYHVQIMQGDLITALGRHLGRIGHVQIAAVPDRGEPGRGEVDLAEVLAALARMGGAGHGGAESRPRSGRTAEGLGWLAGMRAHLARRAAEDAQGGGR
ncbi:MAG: hydroxypyruvate isomerase family protein [Gemmobacter sp.]